MSQSQQASGRPNWAIRNGVALLIACGIGAVLVLLHLTEDIHHVYVLGNLESKLVNQRFLLRHERTPHSDVAIIAIDSKSIAALGRFPWSRTLHAQLVDKLRSAGASTVAFDVLFTERQDEDQARRLKEIAATLPAGTAELEAVRTRIDAALAEILVDQQFAATLEKSIDEDKALVVLPYDFAFEEDLQGIGQLGRTLSDTEEAALLDLASYGSRDANTHRLRTAPPSLALAIRPVITELTEWAAMLGFVNPIQDTDASLRRERMVVVYSPQVRRAYEQLGSMEAARGALLDETAKVQAFMPLAMSAVSIHLRLALDEIVLDLPTSEVRYGAEGEQRVFRFDPDDGTAIIDYYGGVGTFPTYSFVDVLRDELVDKDGARISAAAALGGKLLFVGATDPGLGDDFPTPFSARLSGVEKHANVAANLLEQRQVAPHRHWDRVLLACTLAAAVLVVLLAGNLPPVAAAGLLLAAAAGYYVTTMRDFANHGTLWNWTVPGLTLLLGYSGVTAYRQLVELRARRAQEARSRYVQNTFGRYLSDEVVKVLLDSPEGLKLGGEKKVLTILMSDLRGFTSLCERHPPEVVIGMLNHYLGTMADLVLKYGGTVDEFIGDAILALFGAPVAKPDDAKRAVACAIEMQLAMEDVNRHCKEQGLPEVEMGIALNTGDVIVGNIGSERRSKYGVVGSNVNLTARIESYTVGGQVLISGSTLERCDDLVDVGNKIEVKAKGLQEPVPAYVVKGIGGDFKLELKEIEEILVPLIDPVAVKYATLEGKHVGALMRNAKLVSLSKLGGDLKTSKTLAALTNLKLKVLDADGQPLDGDLYGKVVEREAPAGCVPLRWTSQPPNIKKVLEAAFKAACAAEAPTAPHVRPTPPTAPPAQSDTESDGSSALFKPPAGDD